MNYKFTNDFEKNEFLGRESLKELQILNPTIFKYEINYTDYQYELYDAFFHIMEDTKIKKTIFIEIKYRYTSYDTYMLEKKKVSDLNKLIKKNLYLKEGEYSIFYLNFCPEGTYMWDITNIKPEDCTDKLYANKYTVLSRNDKKSKFCKLMKIEDAKFFDYRLNENRLLKNNYMKSYIIPKVEKKIEKNGLDWILFGEGDGYN